VIVRYKTLEQFEVLHRAILRGGGRS